MKLSTGKSIADFAGDIIGINRELNTIYEGRDGVIAYIEKPDWKDEDYEPELTKEEMIEVCEMMIKRWSDFKEKVLLTRKS